ncbi:SMI1/KNR4 family protein [Chitinophaga qingshengii]|uniref:SMI1/KNR4 family protein n=1 Tax=Chitinophaga qingshengii TaxID=1569794 RepID=A0ABR7TGY8_9BACT|nr:SMI1/KNR4 family protein [Chitinophaga qingshengii]MBC9929753.1 SMI1/KNR4 family protein [Chitinophaga qingshengii]
MEIIAYQNGSKESVSALEKRYKTKLPQDYKAFLTTSNGAIINNAYLYVRDLKEYMLMGNFFGTGIDKPFADIVKINEEYNDDIPESSLLIGSDAGSGLLLLVNDGENDGIWYYDHTYFFKQSTDELNTYFICETFTAFMEMLKETKLPG